MAITQMITPTASQLHAIRVSEAADKYVSDNFDSIVAQSSATKAFCF